jgi:hypothetical protein
MEQAIVDGNWKNERGKKGSFSVFYSSIFHLLSSILFPS